MTTLSISSKEAPLTVVLGGSALLCEGSPFKSIGEAAKVLEYAPVGLSVAGDDGLVMRISRDHAQWRYKLKGVLSIESPLLDEFDAVPEVAYEVEPIDYIWNRAKRVRMKK